MSYHRLQSKAYDSRLNLEEQTPARMYKLAEPGFLLARLEVVVVQLTVAGPRNRNLGPHEVVHAMRTPRTREICRSRYHRS